MTQFFLSIHWEKKIDSFDLKSWVTWVETHTFKLKKKTLIYCIGNGYPKRNGQSSIIDKAVNKQITSRLLRHKRYFKLILKSFDFQCDFDFQITTSKIILILNHLYLGDLILILKSSTYDDFPYLSLYSIFTPYYWTSLQSIIHIIIISFEDVIKRKGKFPSSILI